MALEPYIELSAQKYNSASRQHIIKRLANRHNFPPNIPGQIESFGLEAAVDFMQKGINAGYVSAFIDIDITSLLLSFNIKINIMKNLND